MLCQSFRTELFDCFLEFTSFAPQEMAPIIIIYHLFRTQRKTMQNEIKTLNAIRKCRYSVLTITMVDSVKIHAHPTSIKCLQLYKLWLRQQY
jgi:preprotein translocase subunit YajC